MRMDELNTKIIEWAVEREIDRKGTIQGQAIKTIEEMSELVKGICKNDIDLIKDSIGDVYVTLTIGCMLRDKWGFGKKRLQDFMFEFAEQIECLKKGYVSLEDMINVIQEETGLDIKDFIKF